MANQIVLAWTVDVTNTSLGPAGAAAALGAVPLYQNPVTDPVLGQFFGLTVASDVSAASGPTTATRTLTLNMNHVLGPPTAPPPFPAGPDTLSNDPDNDAPSPELPYSLRTAKTLAESFFVTNGSTSVPTTASQVPALSIGDEIQFLSQPGAVYAVAGVSATVVTLLVPYTGGVSGNTGAFKEVPAPTTIAALYSSSDFDTAGVATTPAIPAGSGARIVAVTYHDSLGAGPFTSNVSLTGKRPAAVPISGGIDISQIDSIVIIGIGGFGSSVGQITLVELSSALPPILANRTPADFATTLTDEAQMLISLALAYLPPSYFANAAPMGAQPALAGDFLVTTDSNEVSTTVDQTSALAAGNVIQFAAQIGTLYTIAAVTPKLIKLTTPYTGIDTNNTGGGPNANIGTKGKIGTTVDNEPTGAILVTPSPAAPPTAAQLSAPLGQFVALEIAAPPPNPPLDPATVPTPTFLSGLFTQTLQLAIAGVPVVAQPITFL